MNGYILQKGFITQKIKEKLTIFSGEESLLYTLNDSAGYIFQGIKLGWSEEKIIDGLVKRYGIEKEQAVVDMQQCIASLEKHNIIQKTSSKV